MNVGFNDEEEENEEGAFQFLSVEELLKQQMGREYLIDGLLGWNESTFAWGPWKRGGKSTFWMWLGYRVSLGRPVFGRGIYKQRPHRVLYIARENPAITRDRVVALCHLEGDSPNFVTVTKPICFVRTMSIAYGVTSRPTAWHLLLSIRSFAPSPLARMMRRVPTSAA